MLNDHTQNVAGVQELRGKNISGVHMQHSADWPLEACLKITMADRKGLFGDLTNSISCSCSFHFLKFQNRIDYINA